MTPDPHPKAVYNDNCTQLVLAILNYTRAQILHQVQHCCAELLQLLLIPVANLALVKIGIVPLFRQIGAPLFMGKDVTY